MNAETLSDQSMHQASYQHAMLREHIAALQEQLLGYELIRAAGEAGLAVGNTDVFAAVTARPHDTGVLRDALQIARVWSYTHNAKDFAQRMQDRSMDTQAGEFAVACIIDHWDAVQPKFLPFKDPEEHGMENDTSE